MPLFDDKLVKIIDSLMNRTIVATEADLGAIENYHFNKALKTIDDDSLMNIEDMEKFSSGISFNKEDCDITNFGGAGDSEFIYSKILGIKYDERVSNPIFSNFLVNPKIPKREEIQP